jgi:hypothetical protein
MSLTNDYTVGIVYGFTGSIIHRIIEQIIKYNKYSLLFHSLCGASIGVISIKFTNMCFQNYINKSDTKLAVSICTGIMLGYSDRIIKTYVDRSKKRFVMTQKYQNDIDTIIKIMNLPNYTIKYNFPGHTIKYTPSFFKDMENIYIKKDFIETHPDFDPPDEEYITIVFNYLDDNIGIVYYKSKNKSCMNILTTIYSMRNISYPGSKLNLITGYDNGQYFYYIKHTVDGFNSYIDHYYVGKNSVVNFIECLEYTKLYGDIDVNLSIDVIREYYEKINKDFPQKIANIMRFTFGQLGG